MLLKVRSETFELLVMRYLNVRSELTEKEKFHYFNLEKGFEGEVTFDRLAEGIQDERYIINDLLLEVNNSYFQIDSLIISQGVIHILDIKNFQGDYYLENDNLYSLTSGRECKNPVDQLKRSATLLRQLLQNLKQNYLVEASLIFINPEFTLYQAPVNQPYILPTQINRFIIDLNKTPSKLNDGHQKLAQKLISLHQAKSAFPLLPTYSYDQLHKGIYCKICKSYSVSLLNHNTFVCGQCGEYEKIELGILRNVEEYKLLFPNQKITTQSIYEWCKVELDKRTFCRILKKNYTTIGTTKDTYYE